MFYQRFKELTDSIANCIYTAEGQRIFSEEEALNAAFEILSEVLVKKGVVYVIGNGGSAGIASHFSSDLTKTLKIPSLTLYDSNLMTCLSNDLGYENVFSFPLSQLLKPQDLLVSISSSGKSPNIIQAAQTARALQIPLITLSGFSPHNPLRQLGQLNFWIDRSDYGLVETSHFFLLHAIVDLWHKRSMLEPAHAKVDCR